MRTSFRHQSEAQPPNGPLTAATSPDTPSYMASQPVPSLGAMFRSQKFTRHSRELSRRWRVSVGYFSRFLVTFVEFPPRVSGREFSISVC
jgi:hypothetical protein